MLQDWRCFAVLGLGLAVACTTTDEPVPPPVEPDREAALAAAAAQAEVVRAQASVSDGNAPTPVADVREGVAPPVLLVWDNVGDLYQSFFARTEAVTALSEDLTGYANGPVNVHVRWVQEEFLGTIRLRILPGTLIAPDLGEGNTVPLQSLAPLTTALASYRAEVAGRFDVRIASFRVSLESFAGARHCVFPIAGTPPPDGRVVSPCVLLNGEERCGTPEADGVVFAPDVAADLRACLTPQG